MSTLEVRCPLQAKHLLCRYLEDFIDLLHYAPPGSKRGVKAQNDKEYEDRLRSQGLSDRGISSIRNIIATDRTDYQVRKLFLNLLYLILVLVNFHAHQIHCIFSRFSRWYPRFPPRC